VPPPLKPAVMPAATTVSEMYMAAKKTPKKPTPNKSDFIRSQPTSMSAAEIVAKAKAAGINFASVLVYKVRGRAKNKGSAPKKTSTMTMSAPMTSSTNPPTSKSSFIRSLSKDLPAREVVTQAKKVGMKLEVSYVYNVRQAAKNASKSKRAAVSAAVSTAANGGSRVSTSAENLLKAVAAEIGLGTAIGILSGERARVAAAFGG
jgi:hypothetical protein